MSESQKPGIELVLEPKTARFDPTDERWHGQVSDFYTGLQGEVGGLRRRRSEVPGTKGGVETVILALGSAGAFTAAVEYFRAWLGRDRTRSLEIVHTVDGHAETFTIRGEAIDNSVLEALAAAIGSNVAGRDG